MAKGLVGTGRSTFKLYGIVAFWQQCQYFHEHEEKERNRVLGIALETSVPVLL